MSDSEDEYGYQTFTEQATGAEKNKIRGKTGEYHFDKYEIEILLGPGNEFLAITEVRVRKDFLSRKQRSGTKGPHDVDEFYGK